MIYSQYTEFFGGIGDGSIGLLVNGMSGAVDLVSGSAYDAWNQRLEPHFFADSVRARLLGRGHFFAGSAESEHAFFVSVAAALHEIDAANATNAFWIIPTYRCNLRCSYCFQDHALHGGENAFQRDLTPSEAIELVDSLERYGGIGKRADWPRYITLFGGEPLMQSVAASVRTLVKYARSKGYKISAVSNGVDLEHFSDILGPDHIRWVQITLDGLEASNEKRRISCGKSSFDAIVRGIDNALALGVKVSLRTNVDRKLLGELSVMDEWIKARGWAGLKNFRWYTAPLEAHTNPSLRKVAATTGDLVSHWSNHRHMKGRPPYVGKHAATLRKLRQTGIGDRIETSACGAHTGMLFFDPQGDVYACAEQAGQADLAIGRWRGVETARPTLPWARRHVGASPICSRCTNAFFCGGGCANAAWSASGDFFGPRCNGIKEAIDFASREFAEKLLTDEHIASQLSASDIYSVNEDGVVLTAGSPESYVAKVSCVRP